MTENWLYDVEKVKNRHDKSVVEIHSMYPELLLSNVSSPELVFSNLTAGMRWVLFCRKSGSTWSYCKNSNFKIYWIQSSLFEKFPHGSIKYAAGFM